MSIDTTRRHQGYTVGSLHASHMLCVEYIRLWSIKHDQCASRNPTMYPFRLFATSITPHDFSLRVGLYFSLVVVVSLPSSRSSFVSENGSKNATSNPAVFARAPSSLPPSLPCIMCERISRLKLTGKLETTFKGSHPGFRHGLYCYVDSHSWWHFHQVPRRLPVAAGPALGLGQFRPSPRPM